VLSVCWPAWGGVVIRRKSGSNSSAIQHHVELRQIVVAELDMKYPPVNEYELLEYFHELPSVFF
jgi:hypothetical protein